MNSNKNNPYHIEFICPDEIVSLFYQLNFTLAFSSYSANKLILLSANNSKALKLSSFYFDEPKGLSIQNNQLAIATYNKVHTFAFHEGLNHLHITQNSDCDAAYYPQLTYYTNYLDLHDLSYTSQKEIFAVSADFSAIVKLDAEFHFKPYWKPSFISKLAPEDRCHLNGMALKNDLPKYATAFSAGNTPQSWRKDILHSGVLIDIENDDIIIEGLSMPHSPKIIMLDHNPHILFFESGKGEICLFDIKNKRKETLFSVNGFLRGLSFYKGYLFVGLSKARKSSTTSSLLEIEEDTNAGIAVFDLENRKHIGNISFIERIEEIYEIEIIKDVRAAKILLADKSAHKHGIASPDQVFYKSEKN